MVVEAAQGPWFGVRVRDPAVGPDSFDAPRALPVHSADRSRDGPSNRHPRLVVPSAK